MSSAGRAARLVLDLIRKVKCNVQQSAEEQRGLM